MNTSDTIEITQDIQFIYDQSGDEYNNFYGTLSCDEETSNKIFRTFKENTQNETNCWGGPESEVTQLCSTSSPILLVFKKKRLNWVISNLQEIIKSKA